MLKIVDDNQFICLDFFSGSSSTAHAVMQLNAEDGGNRKFIMVQLPEPCDKIQKPTRQGIKIYVKSERKESEEQEQKLRQMKVYLSKIEKN